MTLDLTRLNGPQREAVTHGATPLLVLAGAGTGKTTVITYRIAHFLRAWSAHPSQILAVTFTNRAAREMRDRAERLADLPPGALSIGTFHGICNRLLRVHGHRIGLPSNFVIYDEDDQLRLMKACSVELNLDAQSFPPRTLRSRIERWKNQGLAPDQVSASGFDRVAEKALEVYRLYRRRCLESSAVDFGDLLLHVATLLSSDKEFRALCTARWRYVLVDEYQDTNPVQYLLLRHLVTPGQSLTVVGDDDQSIYRWRGADIGNILRFEKDFPGAHLVRLEQNYRSTQTILTAANALIAHNVARKGKSLFTHGPSGNSVELRLFASERDEGEAVARQIAETLASGDLAPEEIAVLYRVNAQSRAIEDAFVRSRIPYLIYGGIRFYERREIKDALAYLRLVANPRSEIDFLRVVNAPARGVGKKSLEKLLALQGEFGGTLLDAARTAAAGKAGLAAKPRQGLAAFATLLDRFIQAAPREVPGRLLERLLEESGYLPQLRLEGTEKAAERIENLRELVAALDEYTEAASDPSLQGFLEEIALATDLDSLGVENGQVKLMTLHSAKGLEFRVVYMPGMEENLLPHSRCLTDRATLEEERRLCYVGFTRAKRELRLSAARTRASFGDVRECELSRFVAEIPASVLNLGRPAPNLGCSEVQTVDYDFAAPAPGQTSGFPRGTRVRHASFGEGRVLESKGTGSKVKLTIDFPSVGTKIVVARFVEAV